MTAILDYQIFEKSADYIDLAGFSTWAKFFADNIIMPRNTGTFRTYDSLRSAALCHAAFKCRLDANMNLIKTMNRLEVPEKAVKAVTELVRRHFLKELKIFALRLRIPNASLIEPGDPNLEKAIEKGREVANSMPPTLDSLFASQVHLCWLTGVTGFVQNRRFPDKLRIYSSVVADMSKSFGHDIPGVEFGGLSFSIPLSIVDYPVENDYTKIRKGINKTALESFPKADWSKA